MGLDGAVSLLGERRDVPSLFAAADAFVLSSRWEGLPMVLLEAAAQGVPIVTTDVGGCREIADPEHGAEVVEASINGIAGGMRRVMAMSEEARAGVGAALAGRVREEFDLRKVVAEWEAIYAGALSARPRPTAT